MNRWRLVRLVALSVLVALPTLLIRQGELPGRSDAPVVTERPNIVFITTDDQTLAELAYLPQAQELVGAHGITFSGGLTPHPLCCPARAQFITGQYGQNNGVQHNNGERGGYRSLYEPDNQIGAWLSDGGYQTAMVGKYLNGYNAKQARPEGWTHWNPFTKGVWTYTRTTYANDGNPVTHRDHADLVTTDYALGYLEEFAANDDPFFVWVSYYAPHRKKGASGERSNLAVPTDEYKGTMADVEPPMLSKPSFNQPDVSGLAPYEREGLVNEEQVRKEFQSRIEALQSVDDGVAELVASLEELGELDNTYIIFTSDNGYLIGEHRLKQKNWLFEEALLVPWMIRIPDADSGQVSDVPITSADLAPTLVELAGVTAGRVMDGQSWAPLVRGEPLTWRDTQLIQTGRAEAEIDGGWRARGVRTDRYSYWVDLATGWAQLYDHAVDPYELHNLADNPRYAAVVAELQRRTDLLSTCAGTECVVVFGPVPDPL